VGEAEGPPQRLQRVLPSLNSPSHQNQADEKEGSRIPQYPPSARLAQTLTGHGYTGGYYKSMKIPNPIYCNCTDLPIVQTRDHIIRACPLHEEHRELLREIAPRLDNPRSNLATLFKRDNQPDFVEWLRRSKAFTKAGVPRDRVPPVIILPTTHPPPPTKHPPRFPCRPHSP
jgi:hypothetical protein